LHCDVDVAALYYTSHCALRDKLRTVRLNIELCAPNKSFAIIKTLSTFVSYSCIAIMQMTTPIAR